MIIYISILFFIFINIFVDYNKYKTQKKLFIIIFFSILTIMAMIRSWKVGVDTAQYYRNFNYIVNLDWNEYNSIRYEFGFFALCKILSYFSKDPHILISVTSLIIIPSIGYHIYKYSENIAMSTFLYITLNLYFFHMTGMRQSLASIFILYGFNYLNDEKYIKYIFFTIIATLFHSSAIIMISLVFLKKLNYNNKTYTRTIFIIVICFIFYKSLFSAATIFLDKYSGYSDSVFGVSNYFGALFQFFIGIILYTTVHYLYFNKKKNKEINLFTLRLFSLAVCFQALAMRMNILGRMTPYFWMFGIVAIPNILHNLKIKRKQWIFFIVIISFVYWFIIASYRPEWHGIIPYSTFLND